MGVYRYQPFKLKPMTTTKTTTIDIPDWLLFELILRLPLERVFACRLVSKQWLSISSDPHFIRAYASQAESASRPYWTVLPLCIPHGTSPSSLSSHITLPEVYLQRPRQCEIRFLPGHQPPDNSNYIVAGVSDGLALYYSCENINSNSTSYDFYISNPTYSYNFYISNPITGQWIKACKLNRLPLTSAGDRWGFLTRVDGEFALRSYHIVRAKQDAERPVAVAFDVYCSKSDEWEKYTVALPGGPPGPAGELKMQPSGAAIDGILHWAEMKVGVIAYDPEASPNRVRVIPHPREAAWPYEYLRSCLCVEYRGELRYVRGYTGRNFDFPGFSVWRRVGDYSTGEWCIQFKIESEEIARDVLDYGKFPIKVENYFFDPCDSDAVVLVALGPYERRYVFSCNLKSGEKHIRHDMMVDVNGGRFSSPWGLSLVVPPWPTRVAEKLLERRGGMDVGIV